VARAGSAWSVKGIDEETRAVARSRAGTADLTIGAWVDQAILAYSTSSGPVPSIRTSTGETARPIGNPANLDKDAGPTLTDQDILDLIDRELEASRSRLDGALRPVGYALKDLALRLVAAEALDRGDAPRLGGRDARPRPEPSTAPSLQSPGPGAPPAPPLGSLAPAIADGEIPTPSNVVRLAAADAPEMSPAAARPMPSAPTHSLHDTIIGIETPSIGLREDPLDPRPKADDLSSPDGELGSPAPRRLDPVPPTGSLSVIDPSDMPEPRSLGESAAYLEEPEPSEAFQPAAQLPPQPLDTTRLPAPDLGIRFTGVQGGFESDPDLAVTETRRTNRRRMMRLAAGIIPFLIMGSVAAGYIFAETLGLMPLRSQFTDKVWKHADQARLTFSDAYSEGQKMLDGLIAKANEAEDEGPAQIVVDATSGEPTLRTDQTLLSVAKVEPTNPTADQPIGVGTPNLGKSEDPPIVNLAPSLPREETAPLAKASKKPAPILRTAEATRVDARPLAQRPPPPPIIPGVMTSETVKKPKAPTRLAALPKPPRLKDADIPPSGTNKSISIDALASAARAGDPRSQTELARRYIQGDGVDQDFAEGSEWFREAAIQGVASAQYNLAVLYERGLGVTKDDVRALLWYHSAAEQSHPLAQYNLGIFYLQGRGIPLSYGEAVRWFRAASRQGVSKATYNLAVLTEDGLGVTPDKNKALALYQKAADAGHHEAASRLTLLKNPTGEKTKPATFAETANTQTDELSTGTTVADIQAVLREAGIYSGRIDGIAGPKTRTAIREYQKIQDLPITGIPSETLLDYMKATSGSKPVSS